MDLKAVLDRRRNIEAFLRHHRIGLLTMLFTDMVGSTQMKERLGDAQAVHLIQQHHALVRTLLKRFSEAEEISTSGDSFFIVFARPSDAVRFALEVQAGLRALAVEASQPLLDRVGIHVGEVLIEEGLNPNRPKDLYGIQVDTCARIMSLAEGGQTLLSRSAFDSARQVLKGQPPTELGELAWLRHGMYGVKGLDEAIEICEVGEAGCAPLKPPADTEKAHRQSTPVFTGETNAVPSRPAPRIAPDQQGNLALLRDRVRQFWVGGVLERAAVGEVLLPLGKRSVTTAVEHPWERVLELPDHTRQILPADQGIGELFEAVGRSLLILGEPGAGKTVTLLELARDLIDRSQGDPTQPVPVVLNLSTWNARQRSLVEWLVEELQSKYYIPRKIGRGWVEQSCLMLLLDGLDEVREDQQQACVEAINTFLQDMGAAGLAVCSRQAEYTALPVRLRLNGAISLQPLAPEQIDSLLSNAGPALASLRTVVRADPALRELARTPLMLGVMAQAYEGLSPEQLSDARLQTPEARRQHVFESYIQRMFERKGKGLDAYPRAPTEDWLAWLAGRMRQHSQSLFLIEQLQPSWLSEPVQRWFYWLNSRLWVGLLIIAFAAITVVDSFSYLAVFSQFFGLVFGMFWVLSDRRVGKVKLGGAARFVTVLGLGLVAGGLAVWTSRRLGPRMFLGAGVVLGLGLGLVDGWLAEVRSKSNPREVSDAALPVAARLWLLISGLAVGNLAVWGLHRVYLWLSPWLQRLPVQLPVMEEFWIGELLWWLPGTLVAGALGAMILIGRQPRSLAMDIEPVESLHWTWRSASKGALAGLALGTFLGVLWSLPQPEIGPVLLANIRFGATHGLCVGLLFGGLRGGLVNARTRPNQGTRLSLRNAGLGGLTVIAIIALSIGLEEGLRHLGFASVREDLVAASYSTDRLSAALQYLLSNVVIGLLPAGAWFGGLVVAKHYTLRLALHGAGVMPLRLSRFLDHTVRLAFLQRVGGGYVFIHRLLLDHFSQRRASVPERPTSSRGWGLPQAAMTVAAAFGLTAWLLGETGLWLATRGLPKTEIHTSALPARDPGAKPTHLDLSPHYTAELSSAFHPSAPGNTLETLPTGLRDFAGTTFDVRGMVRLANGWQFRHSHPSRVEGMLVGQKCSRVHFLQAAGNDNEPDGTVLGRYVVHYADARQETIPIIQGQDLRDYWHGPATPWEAAKSVVAWTGTNRFTALFPGCSLRLFKSTWENPRPDTEIRTLDYVSALTLAAPFLIAITVE